MPEVFTPSTEPSFADADDTFAVLLDLIRTGVATTRPELGRRTGLKRSVISQRVQQAIAAGIVDNGGFADSTGGRNPRTLRFRSEAGIICTAVLGTQHVTVGVTDLAGRILGSRKEPWDISVGPEMALRHLADMLDSLFEHGAGGASVWAVGVGVPGPVDFLTGRLVGTPLMPGWHQVDLRAWFERRYRAPVWVDNDLNLMVLGQWQLGPRDLLADGDSILVKVSNGIGAGILSQGRVHRGRNGGGGDIGHVSVPAAAGVPCRCGQTGCLEAMAGGWALVRDATKAATAGSSEFLSKRIEQRGFLVTADVSEGARNADRVCIELIERSARLVGETLSMVISFFNPGSVYIGGIIPGASDLFLTEVRSAVYHHTLPLAARDLRILPAPLELEDGIKGAASLAIEELFSFNHLVRWLPYSSPAGTMDLLYAS